MGKNTPKKNTLSEKFSNVPSNMLEADRVKQASVEKALAERAVDAPPINLTGEQVQRFAECLKVVRTSLEYDAQAGVALKIIRDERLYPDKTFEEFCHREFSKTRRWADLRITAGEELLEWRKLEAENDKKGQKAIESEKPVSQTTLLEFHKVPEAEKPEVFQKAQEIAGDKPVSKSHIRKARPSGERQASRNDEAWTMAVTEEGLQIDLRIGSHTYKRTFTFAQCRAHGIPFPE